MPTLMDELDLLIGAYEDEREAICPLTMSQLGLLQASLIYGTRSEVLSEKLGLSAQMIETHFRNIRRLCGDVTRGEAILIAVRNGWLMSSEDLFASLEV